jgi:hypothetical protein
MPKHGFRTVNFEGRGREITLIAQMPRAAGRKTLDIGQNLFNE